MTPLNHRIKQSNIWTVFSWGCYHCFAINLSFCLVKCHSAQSGVCVHFISFWIQKGRKLCQASLQATLSKKIWDCSQVSVCALAGPWLDCPPPPPTIPTTQPGADRCAKPPSRLQCRESDNIRSILFPVTHSPRPTGKWKTLLEAVKGEQKQKGRWVTVDISVCAGVCVCVCVCIAHP